jgi:hypothetical protein
MKPTTTTPIPSPLGLDPATANQLARSLPAAAKADADALAEIASIASTAKPPR